MWKKECSTAAIVTALTLSLLAYTLPEGGIGVFVLPIPHEGADSILVEKVAVLAQIVCDRIVASHPLFLANPWFGTDTIDVQFNEVSGRFLNDEAEMLIQSSRAKVVLRTVVSMSDSLARISLRAIEIGSGIEVARGELDLYLYNLDAGGAPEPLIGILDSINAEIVQEVTVFGYPFAEDEIGILFVNPRDTSLLAVQWPVLIAALRDGIDSLGITNVRMKSILSDNSLHRSAGAPQLDLSELGFGLNVRGIIAADEGFTAFSDSTGAVTFYFLDPRAAALSDIRVPMTPVKGELCRAILPVSELSEFVVPSSLLAGRLLYESGQYETSEQFFTMIDTLMAEGEITLPWIKFFRAQARHALVRTLPPDSPRRTALSLGALRDYRHCLAAAEEQNDLLGKAYIMFNMADNEQFRGEWQSAVDGFESALRIFRDLGAIREQMLTCTMLGGVHRFLGNWDKAKHIYSENASIAQQSGDSTSMAEVYGNLAMLFELMQQPDSALYAYKHSYALRQSLGDEYGIADLHGKIAMAYKHIGELDSAAQHLYTQIEIGSALKSEPILSKGYFNLGVVQRESGENELALQNFALSLEQMELMGNVAGASRALNNIGAIYHAAGDTTKALDFYQKSLENALNAGEVSLIVRAFTNIADIHSERGEYDTAYELYDSAVRAAEDANDPYNLAMALFAKGLMRIKAGKITDGYLLIRRAVSIGESVDPAAFTEQREFLGRLEKLVEGIR